MWRTDRLTHWRTDGLTDWRSVIQVLPFSQKSWIGSRCDWLWYLPSEYKSCPACTVFNAMKSRFLKKNDIISLPYQCQQSWSLSVRRIICYFYHNFSNKIPALPYQWMLSLNFLITFPNYRATPGAGGFSDLVILQWIYYFYYFLFFSKQMEHISVNNFIIDIRHQSDFDNLSDL